MNAENTTETKVKLPINDLKPLVALGVEMANVADKIGHTKGPGKYAHLISLFDEVTALGAVNFKNVIPQAKDIDAEEMAELKTFIKEKFDIADDKLESVIEKALDIIQKQAEVVVDTIGLVKIIKA